MLKRKQNNISKKPSLIEGEFVDDGKMESSNRDEANADLGGESDDAEEEIIDDDENDEDGSALGPTEFPDDSSEEVFTLFYQISFNIKSHLLFICTVACNYSVVDLVL